MGEWAQSLLWYREAARNGSIAAALQTGIFYWYGMGCEPDDVEAQRYVGLAAEMGNVCAMGHLATFYMEKNLHEASLYWARKVINYTGTDPLTITAAIKAIASLPNNTENEDDIIRSVALSFFVMARSYSAGNTVERNEMLAERFLISATLLSPVLLALEES